MTKIAVYAYDGISMFHLSVPIAIFNDAEPDLPFQLMVFSAQSTTISTSDGSKIEVKYDIEDAHQADIIIIPSWPIEAALSPALKALMTEPSKLCVGLCLGAYALAHAGLLDGKAATTHWASAEEFRAKFPNVHLNIDALYVTESNVITSAGTAAAIDCCLAIVKQRIGAKQANQVARTMVSAPVRAGGQSQFIQYPVPKRNVNAKLDTLVELVLSDLTNPTTLSQAANQVAMSERSFSRHFKAVYGVSFVQWLTQQRLNYALELLESTDLSIALVAEQIGMSSEQNFRKHFKLHFSCSPHHWRSQFRAG